METLGIILLAVIAYFLWKIYRQKEEEKEQIASEKFEAEWEQKKKEEFKNYPHLIGKVDYTWLELFGKLYVEKGLSHLKAAFLLMLQASTEIDLSEGSRKWDTLWDCTEELLEHLEKYHEGSIVEHEIAVTVYWQNASEAVGELIKQSPEKHLSDSGKEWAPIEGSKMEVEPFTDINKIVGFFPKKASHPAAEISFIDEQGKFPRGSEGSTSIHEKLKALGL